MKAHLMDQPPRVTDVVPALPAAFDDVIAIAMAKDPAARFPAAAALAAAATEALRNPNTPSPPSPPVVPVPGPEVISYPHTTPGAPPVFTAPPIYTAPGVPRLGGLATAPSSAHSRVSWCWSRVSVPRWRCGPTPAAPTRMRQQIRKRLLPCRIPPPGRRRAR